MSDVKITVSFPARKAEALNNYLRKKELTMENELEKMMEILYARYVPAAVRTYIDEVKEGGGVYEDTTIRDRD